jgi:3-isopropylmalate/(R)-2-methylmalate dehydratase small subunit
MQPFITLESVAAPLPIVNVDTDMIIPKQFLKTIKRTGLGKHLFDEMRYTQDGAEIADFVLNKAPFRDANILVADDNFGCGSSREHAPWALLDFGIRAVIAPSFADIFFNNCFKNGILPIVLPKQTVQEWLGLLQTKPTTIRVDLPSQTVTLEGAAPVAFEIEKFRKHCLINGLDDIGLTLQKQAAIDAFEQAQKTEKPWLYAA